MNDDGFVAPGDHFAHLMSRILLFEGQGFGKANAVATEKPDDQQAAHIGVFKYNVGTVGKKGGIGIRTTSYVHRVDHGCGRGKYFFEFGHGILGKFRQGDPVVGQNIRGNCGMPAAVGQYGDLVVAHRRAAGQGFSGCEKLIRIFDDDDPGSFKRTFGPLGHSRQGAGV